jgi:hypothetical protein
MDNCDSQIINLEKEKEKEIDNCILTIEQSKCIWCVSFLLLVSSFGSLYKGYYDGVFVLFLYL